MSLFLTRVIFHVCFIWEKVFLIAMLFLIFSSCFTAFVQKKSSFAIVVIFSSFDTIVNTYFTHIHWRKADYSVYLKPQFSSKN